MFFRKRTLEKYEYVGTAITGTIADRLDGDKVISYLETGEVDEYYEEVLKELYQQSTEPLGEGYRRLLAGYLIELYMAQRRYKDALSLRSEHSYA